MNYLIHYGWDFDRERKNQATKKCIIGALMQTIFEVFYYDDAMV
jgi:hypothetical protein